MRLSALAASGVLFGTTACSTIPPGRTAVDSVDVEGASAVDEDDILANISTTPSPKFLKLWSGVLFDYSFYDRFAVKRDLMRVERFYRARGFYDAHARVGRVLPRKGSKVAVVIMVEEGAPVLIRSATLRGIDGLPPDVQAAATSAANGVLKKGAPFDEEEFEKAENAVRRALTDRGYAYAKVTRAANVDLPQFAADAQFDIVPGETATLGKVTVEGLENLPEGPVRRALDLQEGEPYSTRELESAQQAVLDLGVFSSVDIDPQLEPPSPDRVVPVVIRVERTPLHNVQLGVGVELDLIKTDVHGIAQWESKNLFGGLRNFTVRDKPGLVFYPTRLPEMYAPTDLLPENRLRAELRQPGFLEARTTGRLRGEFNVYPLILGTSQPASSTVLGYKEVSGAAGVERTFGKWLFLNPNYNLQANFPFAYVGPSTTLGSVLVSYIDLFASVDFRDDKLHPRKGIFASLDTQLAGGFLGGDARDVRVQPDVRGYIPITRKITLAARASVGFVFPQNYADAYSKNVATGGVGYPGWIRDLQLLFFRGFYSGGATNRGYPLRGVGPHGFVPFLNPEVAAQQFASECISNPNDARCLYPLGGLSLWEASLEVRWPISGPLTGATFCDASDVSPHRLNIRLNRPHPSCGLGARYDTPVGPIRLDIGGRLYEDTTAGEGRPPLLFGFFPGAIAFGIGEAF